MIDLKLDRDKVKSLNVPVKSVFDNLQMYLGGMQAGDFNLYGRTYKVVLQAEPEFRLAASNIGDIYVRGPQQEMIPLSTLLRVERKTGAGMLQRYNMYRTAEFSGAAAPGYSSGRRLAASRNSPATRASSSGVDPLRSCSSNWNPPVEPMPGIGGISNTMPIPSG